ncbi:MAG: hypothetical protein ABEN55_19755 [Bradymonadaceae bacterium]
MPKQSPLQRVRDEHGSKDELVDKILEVLDVPQDEDPLDFEERLATTSNKKLLRIWDYHQLVQEKFGSRQGIVDKITTAKFPGGNPDYADEIADYTLPRLVGLARDHDVLD